MNAPSPSDAGPVLVVADEQARRVLQIEESRPVRVLDNYLEAIGELAHAPAQAVVGGLEAVGLRPGSLIQALRHRHPGLRLVLTAEAADEPEARRLVRLGFDDYLIRPIEPAELRRALEPDPAASLRSPSADRNPAGVLDRLHEDRQVWLPAALEILGRKNGMVLQWREVAEPQVAQPGETPVEGLSGCVGYLRSAAMADPGRLEAVARELGQWIRLSERLLTAQNAADQDALTGLWNRRYLDRMAPRLLEEARESRRMLSVVLWDLDGFKGFNDRRGHPAGDELLKQVAGCLKRSVRREDVVVRLGGDEFLMLLPEQASRRPGSQHRIQVEDLVRRVRAETAKITWPDEEASVPAPTLSAGGATYPWDGSDWPALYAAADRLLRAAKSEGKNRIRLSPF